MQLPFSRSPSNFLLSIPLTIFGLFSVISVSGQIQSNDTLEHKEPQHINGDTLTSILEQLNKAYSLLNTNPNEAYHIAHQAQLLAEISNHTEELFSLYDIQYKAAKQMGQDSLAFVNLAASISARAEALTERESILQEELNEKFSVRQKENEIALLKHEKNLHQLKLTNNKNLLMVVLPSFLILLLLSYLLWLQYMRKKALQLMLKENHTKTLLLNTELTTINNELIRSEQELKYLHEVKNNFFSVVSQDLKSPLNSLSLYLNGFIETTFKNDDAQNFINRINTSVASLSSLLNNLLEWSRLQMGSIQYNAEVVDISKLLKTNIDLVQPQTVHKHIVLKQKLQPDLKALVDKQMLGFVLRKVLSLYIEAVEENGIIIITLKKSIKERDLLSIKIKSRHHIDPTNGLLNAWEFNTHYMEGSEKSSSNMLGLMLCKEFIEKQGGATQISNSKKSIVFTFPLA